MEENPEEEVAVIPLPIYQEMLDSLKWLACLAASVEESDDSEGIIELAEELYNSEEFDD